MDGGGWIWECGDVVGSCGEEVGKREMEIDGDGDR